MSGRGTLRVVDAGDVDALRSQSLWHGIASAMREDAAPTLSFCRPLEPYVGLGYHRSVGEIDLEACRRRGLPVIRRRIGGGPVYLDADQLFFQLTLPARRAPGRVDRLYERLLSPAVEAFRALGLAAGLRGINDIAVGDRKLSGTGAGRIGEAVTVVGNAIFRFPHGRMVEVLALPGEWMRTECLRLMRRHVTSLEAEGLAAVGFGQVREALTRAYARALDATPEPAAATERDLRQMETWERRFADPEWLRNGSRPLGSGGRRVKISADAWLWSAASGDLRVEAAVSNGRLDAVRIGCTRLDGRCESMAAVLRDLPAEETGVGARLRPWGGDGARVADLLAPGLRAMA